MMAASYAEVGRPPGTRGGIETVRANEMELSLDKLPSESIHRTDREAGEPTAGVCPSPGSGSSGSMVEMGAVVGERKVLASMEAVQQGREEKRGEPARGGRPWGLAGGIGDAQTSRGGG